MTTKHHDFLNRLTAVYSRTNSSASSPIVSHYGYQYNDAGQRMRTTSMDGLFWIYEYDELGQVISGRRYWSDFSPVPGQQFEYRFDDIGNRRYTKAGGDASGANLRLSEYAPNALNQYTSRTVPNGTDILGLADAWADVTVNTSPADYRRGEYFWESLGLSLSPTAPLWQSVSVSTGGTPVAGNLLFPPSTQNFQHDEDGNLTNDGVWAYYYDAENRLYRVENLTTLTTASARKKLTFEYDHMGRRIKKSVFNWDTSNYSSTATSETKFYWDGWNMVRETTGSAWKACLWGLDQSGTEQGAGGVGGLLLLNDSSLGASFVCYDGNANVVKLIKATDSTTSGEYEYGPFGEALRVSGPAAAANPFRFSTKYADEFTSLVYYGYRYYNPSTGRWISRDPVGEFDAPTLYGFVSNRPLEFLDRACPN